MRKWICLLAILAIMLCMSGCGFTNARTDELDRSYQSEAEEMEYVEDTVIKALENKDAELLKSIFSQKVLTNAGDIDKGIEYMFSIYRGHFVEITYQNHSVDEHVERNKSTKDIGAWCNFKTDQAEYELSWGDMMKQEADPSAAGVYEIEMREYVEGDNRKYCRVTGINYPERDFVHSMLSAFKKIFQGNRQDEFSSFLSSRLLQAEDISAQTNKLFELFDLLDYTNMGDHWVQYHNNHLCLYSEIRIHDTNYIMYTQFDDEETDKISVLKVTEVEEGQPLSAYDLGESITESGIYLPK